MYKLISMKYEDTEFIGIELSDLATEAYKLHKLNT